MVEDTGARFRKTDMATSQMIEVVQYLRTAMLVRDGAGLTDEQLLGCFVAQRDEAAFAALVRRHGPMVLGVCRRVLGHVQDAEDAFQATFLVLARKAASIATRALLANWLYGVAYNTAIKARATTARRRLREKQVTEMPEPEAVEQDLWNDLQPLLDQELSRLPDRYRVPIVLCELEGKSRKEAALQLGVPEGTIASRLARARTLLARKLVQRGVSLSGVALAGLLSAQQASACVPAALVVSTAKAASLLAAGQTVAGSIVSAKVAALTEGVLKAMFLTKLKIATAVLLAVSIIVCGAGVFRYRALAGKPAAQAVQDKATQPGEVEATELTAVVQSVDAAKSTLTLTSKLLGTKTFDVAKEARVLLDDGTGGKLGFKDGKLSDIGEGFIVTVRLSEGRSRVSGIWAEGPSIRADVKAVSAAQRTITVTIADRKNEPAQEKTFAVAPNATVVFNDGKPKEKVPSEAPKLADVPVGAVVTLKLSADQKVVGAIQAEGQEVQGFIKAVDGAKNSITLSVSDGKQIVERTYAVLPTATIAMGTGKGKGTPPPLAPTLTDLPVGAPVTLKLALHQKAVVRLSIQEVGISGTVKAVDAAKNSITLLIGGSKTEAAEEKTFDVAVNAAVRIDGKEGKLADLPAEALVSVKLFGDRKTVGSLQAEGPSISGIVMSVDAGRSSITLAADKSGEGRTLAISKDAPIFLDGKAGKLADVAVGALVQGKLTTDQKGLVSLNVSGPSFRGVLKGVDAVKGQITVTVFIRKGEPENKVFDLAKEVAISTAGRKDKAGVPLKLADLKAENEIVLQLAADSKTVMVIRAVEE